MQRHADEDILANATTARQKIPKVAKGTPHWGRLGVLLDGEQPDLPAPELNVVLAELQATFKFQHLIAQRTRSIRALEGLISPQGFGVPMQDHGHPAKPSRAVKPRWTQPNGGQCLKCGRTEFFGFAHLQGGGFHGLDR